MPKEKIFKSFTSIGGKKGCFSYNILWQIRGLIDKLIGGVGLNHGRRENDTLRLGDSVDFWKVVDIRKNKRLLLYAQMKLPGKAWLEFDIQGDTLVQTAHFHPNGVYGRVYWYIFVPFHKLFFGSLVKKIVKNYK